jgi:hypothetical protein
MSKKTYDTGQGQGDLPSDEAKVVNLDNVQSDRITNKTGETNKVQERRRHRDRMVRQFNERHCVCDDHGTVWIFKEAEEVDQKMRPGHHTIYRETAKDFLQFYSNKELTCDLPAPTAAKPEAVKIVTKSAAWWWLRDKNRRTYERVIFLPGVTAPPGGYVHDCFNLWRGWGVKPVQPRRGVDWPLMRQHLYRVICSGNDVWFEYVMNWLAYMVQHPGEVGHTAIVLRGGEGVGKGFLAQYLLRIFGPHGLHLHNSAHLHGRYNIHLQHCIFLFSDEAYYPGDKAMEGVIRALITEERLPVEAKYQNLFETNNCVHLLISSNNEWVVPMATDARRFFVLDVPDTRKGDTAYWGALGYELEHGGPAAMLGELLRRNIKFFNPREVPDTRASREQKRLSLDTVKQFLMAALDRGYPYRPRHDVPSLRVWQPFYTTEW